MSKKGQNGPSKPKEGSLMFPVGFGKTYEDVIYGKIAVCTAEELEEILVDLAESNGADDGDITPINPPDKWGL